MSIFAGAKQAVAQMTRIPIPNVAREERIGQVFNQLCHVLYCTRVCEDEDVVWDFSGVQFLHPFLLGSLGVIRQSSRKRIHVDHIAQRVAGYYELIHFGNPLQVGSKTGSEQLQEYAARTYLPLCSIDLSAHNIGDLSTILTTLISNQCHADAGVTNPLNYFFGELIDNMFEHSCGSHGYLFAQRLASEHCINLLLADDGNNIYESYRRTNKYLREINGDEAMALRMACEGKSTKELPDAESRGFGISSSSRMLVEGMGGAFFILSGTAFHRRDASGSYYANIPEQIRWAGTIILMKIPMSLPAGFNYTIYIE